MFSKLKSLAKQVKKLNENDLILFVYDNDGFQEEVIYLNTVEQLYNKGIDSTGERIGDYSSFTKALKAEKGQPTDRVTLKDTGDFYRSFRLQLTPDYSILINADSDKGGGDDLREIYGKEIIGLTKENLEKIVKLAQQIAINYVKKIKNENN